MTKLAPVFFLALFGCSKSTTPAASTSTPEPEPELTAEAQIAQGQALFVEHCAGCHGDAGQGGEDAPPVVGADAFPLAPREGAKRDVEFRTAADVFAWATMHMPPRDPGGLSTEEYLAIFAFDLTANGIELTEPLDGAAAAAIVLHP